MSDKNGLLREVKILLLSGANIRQFAQDREDWVIERISSIAEFVLEHCGPHDPMEVAQLISADAAMLMASRADAQTQVSVERAKNMLSILGEAGGKPEVAPSPTAKKAPAKKPPAKRAAKKPVAEKPVAEKPAEPAKESVDPKQIGISSLGVPNGVRDKLFDLGLGTAASVLEYEVNAGLHTVFGVNVSKDIMVAVEKALKG